jgi:hypothetical protein
MSPKIKQITQKTAQKKYQRDNPKIDDDFGFGHYFVEQETEWNAGKVAEFEPFAHGRHVRAKKEGKLATISSTY